MKLNRRKLRRLIESIMKEGEQKAYFVPGYRDRPGKIEYTINHTGGELVLDTISAGSKILVTFLDDLDSEGNAVIKRYATEGVITSIPFPTGKHRITVSSLR